VISSTELPGSLQTIDASTGATLAVVERFVPQPLPDTPATSPDIGLTASETAELGVINDGTVPQTETLSILDGAGAVVATQSITIAPGQMGSITYTTSSPRVEIHAAISPTLLPASLQVLDSASHRTLALVESFTPTPVPDMPATSADIGLVAGDTAKLSVINTGTVALSETLFLVSAKGITVATKTLSVAPGHVGAITYAPRRLLNNPPASARDRYARPRDFGHARTQRTQP
jgi:hypothetical protein